ncbi:MAG: hypothetical protein ACF8PN_06115 [Phycisphaerales bacterium]
MAKRKLSGFSLEELRRELNMRRDELESERAQLQARIDEIDAELGSMSGGGGAGGTKKRRRRGRPPGSKNRKKTTGNGRRKKKTTKKKSSRRGGRRPRNKQTLVEAMHSAVQGKTMGVSEIAEAVQKNGYKTSADNFRTIVNQTLIKNKDKFKKVERGRYTTA